MNALVCCCYSICLFFLLINKFALHLVETWMNLTLLMFCVSMLLSWRLQYSIVLQSAGLLRMLRIGAHLAPSKNVRCCPRLGMHRSYFSYDSLRVHLLWIATQLTSRSLCLVMAHTARDQHTIFSFNSQFRQGYSLWPMVVHYARLASQVEKSANEALTSVQSYC